MPEQKVNLKIPEHILAVAKENNIKLCVPETNGITLQGKDIPDVHGVLIGKQDKNTDKLTSYIKDDDDCAVLQKYIDLGLVTTKKFCQMTDNNELKNVPHYFVLYDVIESSKNTPTYIEDGPGDGSPMNGHYVCQYEVLLGTEDYTKRMVFETRSVNLHMGDWIKDFIEIIEEVLMSPEELDELDNIPELKEYIKTQDDILCITMFDSVGIPTDIECESESTFLSFIRSIRQLDCKFVEN